MINTLAIVCVRNEALHIARCIGDLVAGGCDVCLIDHGSTDRTVEIAERFFDHGLVGIDALPWTGAFSLSDQLALKAAIARKAPYDWIVHADADEWLVSPVKGQRLIDAIRDADASGFNVINFHEMVFVPPPGVSYETENYASFMREYYFFQPYFPRLNRAWRRDAMLNNCRSGGHLVDGAHVNRYPYDLILRHYIALSQAQFKSKYLSRRYSGDDLRRNWHANRLTIDEDNLAIRSGPAMRRLPSPLDHDKFDLSRPVDTHFWQWPKAEPVDGPYPDAADPPKAPHRGEE